MNGFIHPLIGQVRRAGGLCEPGTQRDDGVVRDGEWCVDDLYPALGGPSWPVRRDTQPVGGSANEGRLHQPLPRYALQHRYSSL